MFRPATTFATLVMLLVGMEAFGQCLHDADETSANQRRRESAVEYVGAVTDSEARFLKQTGGYGLLHQLQPAASAPVGFVPRLFADQFGYLLKVTDTLDPCQFTLFSDERGVVFEARPLPPAPAGDEPGPPAAAPAATSSEARDRSGRVAASTRVAPLADGAAPGRQLSSDCGAGV